MLAPATSLLSRFKVTKPANPIAFSPDGTRIVSGSDGLTIRV
jgi:WD40 repeat protein